MLVKHMGFTQVSRTCPPEECQAAERLEVGIRFAEFGVSAKGIPHLATPRNLGLGGGWWCRNPSFLSWDASPELWEKCGPRPVSVRREPPGRILGVRSHTEHRRARWPRTPRNQVLGRDEAMPSGPGHNGKRAGLRMREGCGGR